MFHKASTLALALVLFSGTTALADGMPFFERKPQPILTPLDHALSQETTSQTVEPLDVTLPEANDPLDLERPPIEQDMPESLATPLGPESRSVQAQPHSSFLGLSIGLYDAVTHGLRAASLNVEWQPGVRILGSVQPLFGAMVTTDETIYAYGGLGVPFEIARSLFLMPSVAVGYYHEGDGYDLGRSVAYRFGTELAYQFENNSRLGLNAHVITNAKSLDKKDRTEVISIVYTTPLNVFSGSGRK